MVKRSIVFVSVIVSVLGCAFSGFAEVGMVLLKGDSENDMVLTYLSDGREVVLEDCCTKGAKFSPDGKHVAMRVNRRDLVIMNIDGSGRTNPGRSTVMQWCADGYIYSGVGNPNGLARLRPDGSGGERIYNLHHDNMGAHGKVFKIRMGKAEISMDGKNLCYTTLCRCEGSGWGQAVALVDQDKEYALTAPCVGAISPHGDMLGKANPVGGGAHTRYAIYPWERIYRYESDSRNTFYYRTPVEWCLDTFVTPDERATGSVSWSKDPDVLTFTLEYDSTTWMYRMSTKEKTLLGRNCAVQDYYPRELEMDDTSFYVTPLALAFETEIGDAEMPPSRTIYVDASHTLPSPTIGGVPAWLEVTAETFDDRTELTNALKQSGIPSNTGSYEATITLSYDGFTQEQQYAAALDVYEQRPDPVRFVAPDIQTHYSTGETIQIGYSADCARAGDKVNIAISVDSGTSWGFVDSSFLGKNCGDNQVFPFEIPDSLLFYYTHDPDDEYNTNGYKMAVQGSQCLIRLRAYHPGGPEVYSSTFSIGATGTAPQRYVAGERITRLGATARVFSGGAVLSLRSPRGGVGRVLDVQGRIVVHLGVERGERSVSLPRLRAGCYLLEVRYAGGGRETTVVNVQ